MTSKNSPKNVQLAPLDVHQKSDNILGTLPLGNKSFTVASWNTAGLNPKWVDQD